MRSDKPVDRGHTGRMRRGHEHDQADAPHTARPADDGRDSANPASFSPPIETRDVFRQLIVDEIRNGRMTRARRKRIVQYAAQMGLSAVEAGRLIAACRDELLQSESAETRGHALRLVEPESERIPTVYKIWAIIAIVTILDLWLLARIW